MEKIDPSAFSHFVEQPFMCTACGDTGVFAYDSSTMECDVNFFPCECGVEGKKIRTGDAGNA